MSRVRRPLGGSSWIRTSAAVGRVARGTPHRAPDHRVGARVFGWDGREVEIDALVLGEEVERALHAREHAECQHIDLHEFEAIDVVLVPLDHLAVDHRCRFDRHELVEPIVGQHEAARMLAQMPRRAHELARQIERQAQRRSDD
jgi:hypothetical protein